MIAEDRSRTHVRQTADSFNQQAWNGLGLLWFSYFSFTTDEDAYSINRKFQEADKQPDYQTRSQGYWLLSQVHTLSLIWLPINRPERSCNNLKMRQGLEAKVQKGKVIRFVLCFSRAKGDIPKHRYMTDFGQKGLVTMRCCPSIRLGHGTERFSKKERYYASVLRGVVHVGDRSDRERVEAFKRGKRRGRRQQWRGGRTGW
jgi:hypothetical protein